MKLQLKKLVSMMAVMGVVSTPVFADEDKVDHKALMANVVNRNQDNVASDPTSVMPEWFKNVTITGVFSPQVKFGMGQGAHGNTTKASQSVSVRSAELYVDAQLADWVSAHMTLAYDVDPATAYKYADPTNNQLQDPVFFAEEGTITLANFNKSPLWMTLGRQYLLFGSTMRSSISKPLSQYLSEGNSLALTVGAAQSVGGGYQVNGDVYGFQGVQKKTSSSAVINAWGANLGLGQSTADYATNLNVGYLSNLMDTYFIGNNQSKDFYNSGYTKRVDGLSVHVDTSMGPFSLIGDVVTALSHFDSEDLQSNSLTKGAKPWAYSLEATYRFPVMDYKGKVYTGYQQSGDAANVSSDTALGGYWMPKNRWLAGYGMSFTDNFSMRLQYQYDQDYKVTEGGNGKHDHALLTEVTAAF